MTRSKWPLAPSAGLDAVRDKPVVMTVINVNSPLRFDDVMSGGLLTFARAGQVPIVTPFILAGAMGPITIAGAVAQQNAEALVGIGLAQLANPGVPVMYGGFTTDTHMRSGNPSFGSPEGAWAALVGAQMARRYHLPYPFQRRAKLLAKPPTRRPPTRA